MTHYIYHINSIRLRPNFLHSNIRDTGRGNSHTKRMANRQVIDVLAAIEFPIQFPVTYKVLVATSDHNCAKNLEDVLNQYGFQVMSTNNGVEAVALVRDGRDKFDFVFCDEHVDDIDGYSVAGSIRMNTNIPTIYTYSAEKGPAWRFNLVEWALSKPVTTDNVEKLLKRVRWIRGVAARCKVKRMIETFPSDDVWASEVHYKFVAAIYVLGEKACPESIMEFMKVEGLSEMDVENQYERYKAHAQQHKRTRVIRPVIHDVKV